MPLRFLADQGIAKAVILGLRDDGHTVLRVREVILHNSPDELIIATAQQHDCILLSLDSDFADIVAYPPSQYKGIVALQEKNHPRILPYLLAKLRSHIITNPDMADYMGLLLIVEAHQIRVRR